MARPSRSVILGMGPAARWRHAMAFDSARGHLVLFGGRTTPGQAEPPAKGLSGETWEDSGLDAPPLVQVASVTAKPANLAVNDTTTVNVTFTATAPAGMILQIGWIGAGLSDLADASGVPLSQIQSLDVECQVSPNFELQLKRFQNSMGASQGDVIATVGADLYDNAWQRVELRAR